MALLKTIRRLVWGKGTIFFLLGLGLSLLAASRFYPFRKPLAILRATVGQAGRPGRDGASPFAAMSAALGGTMGVGNIIGVAAAITAGGPGAIFWLWVCGCCGMMLKYAEVYLAVEYRVPSPQGWQGGPMYYISGGLGLPALGGVFAVCCLLASFGMGNMAQTGALAEALESALHWDRRWTAVLLFGAVLAAVSGGAKRMIRLSSCLVPVMTLLYLLAAGALLWTRRQTLPGIFQSILRGAFGLRAAGGASLALLWQAVEAGVTRSIFTSEAGLGSASIAHACADCRDPHSQALWGFFEVAADTLVVCTVTALVILSGGEELLTLPAEQITAASFSMAFGRAGELLVQWSIVLFALAALFGWGLYGERALYYLKGGPVPQKGYHLLFALAAAAGCFIGREKLWLLSDCLNGLMMLPNLAALLLLSPAVIRRLRRPSGIRQGQGA